MLITAGVDDLQEGLFGQVLLFVFEILPYLAANNLKPHWHIEAKLYESADGGPVIPGILDLSYQPDAAGQSVELARLRRRHCSILGDDWSALNALWTRFFKIPDRIIQDADAIGSMRNTLGVHFRGTDKQHATWDTNPVRHEDMVLIVGDFLRKNPKIERIFVASDDPDFAAVLQDAVDLDVTHLGPIKPHIAVTDGADRSLGADRALLDCLLLSRCDAVLKTSSALSAFCKILRPSLTIYRCSASKLFADIPYFPVAYIDPYRSDDAAVNAVLDRLMADDWTNRRRRRRFAARPRHRLRSWQWRAIETLFPLARG